MNRPNPWEPRSAIDPRIREGRFRELLQVTGENQIVYQIACLFAKGEIISFEEALQQIIRHLVRQNENLQDLLQEKVRYDWPSIRISVQDLATLQEEFKCQPPTATGAKITKENEE